MNSAQIYEASIDPLSAALGNRQVENTLTNKAIDEEIKQSQLKAWLELPTTQGFLADIIAEADALEEHATLLVALGRDELSIRRTLTESGTLRKVINYARTRQYNSSLK